MFICGRNVCISEPELEDKKHSEIHLEWPCYKSVSNCQHGIFKWLKNAHVLLWVYVPNYSFQLGYMTRWSTFKDSNISTVNMTDYNK